MCRSSQTPLPVCEEQFGKSGALVSLVMLTVGEETQTESISINFSMALAQKRLGCEIASVLSRQNVLCWFLLFIYNSFNESHKGLTDYKLHEISK